MTHPRNLQQWENNRFSLGVYNKIETMNTSSQQVFYDFYHQGCT